MSNTERIVNAERVEDLIVVFGSFDENIKRIEEALGVSIINRGTALCALEGLRGVVARLTRVSRRAVRRSTAVSSATVARAMFRAST